MLPPTEEPNGDPLDAIWQAALRSSWTMAPGTRVCRALEDFPHPSHALALNRAQADVTRLLQSLASCAPDVQIALASPSQRGKQMYLGLAWPSRGAHTLPHPNLVMAGGHCLRYKRNHPTTKCRSRVGVRLCAWIGIASS